MFTIVTPTFNRGPRLAAMVSSVLQQHHGDFELVIVDDGSTDETAAIVESFHDERIRYLRQQRQGAAVARNVGLAAAAGAYVVFLDSDDTVDTDWLSCFAQLLADTSVGLAFCGTRMIDDTTGEAIDTLLPRDLGPAYHHVVGYFLAGSFCVRKELLTAIGGYRDIPAAQQQELALRLCAYVHTHNIRTTSTDLAHISYFQHSESHIRRNFAAVLRGDLCVLEDHADLLDRDRGLKIKFLSEAGVCAARTSDFAMARSLLLRAALTRPTDPALWARLLLSASDSIARRVWPASLEDELARDLREHLRKSGVQFFRSRRQKRRQA